jgi:HSP90 family molecular chaperone
LNEFDGKKLKSVEKGEFDLGTDKEKKESKKKLEESAKEYEGTSRPAQGLLKER